MKSLLLLRHAHAVPQSGGPDRDRPLSESGVRSCALLAGYLGAHAARPELVLCSPAARTRETLKRIAAILGWQPHREEPKVRFVEALYFATADGLLDCIRAADDGTDTLLVLGHNPGIEDLAAHLARAGDPSAIATLGRKFPAGGLAGFAVAAARWRETGPGNAALRYFVSPKTLEPGGG